MGEGWGVGAGGGRGGGAHGAGGLCLGLWMRSRGPCEQGENGVFCALVLPGSGIKRKRNSINLQ